MRFAGSRHRNKDCISLQSWPLYPFKLCLVLGVYQYAGIDSLQSVDSMWVSTLT